MDTTISTGLERATLQLGVPEIVRQLNVALGPTLVAALAATKDRKAPVRWARFDDPSVPRPEAERRLRFAHRMLLLVSSVEGEHVARAWFIGCNPRLDEDSPINAIHDGRFQEVSAAAIALAEGTYGA